MSRIGKQPVSIPAGVEVNISGSTITVKGPKGELNWDFPREISVKQEDAIVQVSVNGNSKFARSMFGTARALIDNMMEGVTKGYTKELELHGVGFRAQLKGNIMVLNLGYSHPIEFVIPEGLNAEINNNTEIKLFSADKQMVGQAAAQIRAYYKAEPYKGKGVRYKGENVRRKVGKAVS